MESIQTVELIIDSTDASEISEIESQLNSVQVTRGRTARLIDPITALAVAAGTVQLISELTSLWQKLRTKPDPPKVTVRNANGDSIEMSEISVEQLRAFLEIKPA